MRNTDYEIVIGLEVHIQLATKSKAFCACSTEFGVSPNTNICPVCCGYPGVLPVLNEAALKLALRVCLSLNCRINSRIYFERKNYFYPDLPKNYQISQYQVPLGEDGYLQLPSSQKIGIKRVHLEEDAGKLIHRDTYSLVDLNRAGVPLLEIVSQPDIHTPHQAYDYLNYLKLTIQYLGASSCDMEKGFLRCDANISVKGREDKTLGTKVELKNMNSFRGVRDALEYESKRQIALLEKGKQIFQETRLWDDLKRKTFVMRTKEEACDYRYFPEPDLVDFVIDKEMIEKEKESIKELPLEKRARFLKEYPLTEQEIDILISSSFLADFFEEGLKYLNDCKNMANWIIGPLREAVNNRSIGWEEMKLSPYNFSKIVRYFKEGKLNNLAAKKILSLALTTNEDIDYLIEKEGLLQVSGEDDLMGFVEEVIKTNPQAVNDFLQGKQQAIMFLVGGVMKRTRGKANPKVVKELLERRLKQ